MMVHLLRQGSLCERRSTWDLIAVQIDDDIDLLAVTEVSGGGTGNLVNDFFGVSTRSVGERDALAGGDVVPPSAGSPLDFRRSPLDP
jgi:hypothetical protein